MSATCKDFSYSKVFPGTKYAVNTEKKEGKPTFQNIKDLTNRSLKITKFGSSHYERFCEANVLEKYTESLQRLVKEYNVMESCIPL